MNYSENPLQNLSYLPQELIKKICRSLDKVYIKENMDHIMKLVHKIKAYLKDDFYANEHQSRDFPVQSYTIHIHRKDGNRLTYIIDVYKRNEYFETIMRMKAYSIIEIKHDGTTIGTLTTDMPYVLWSDESETMTSEMKIENTTQNNVKFATLFMRTFDDTQYQKTFGQCLPLIGGGKYTKTNKKFGNRIIYKKDTSEYIRFKSEYINITPKK